MNAASWLEGPSADKWRALVARRGPLAATALLAALIAMQAGGIVVDLTSGGPAAATPLPPSAPALERHLGTNVGLITNAHLFGTQPVARAAPQDPENAPASTIPLMLTGLVARDDPQGGMAIIGQNGQATKVYTVGETVPGGAKLTAVYADRAVIDRDGHLESLMLPRQSRNGVGRPPPSTAALQTETPVADRLRRLSEQPGVIADIMRPQPVMGQDNKLLGFRVFPGRNHQAFSRLGLRPGDVVTAINGTALDDFSRGQEIMQTLDSASEAHVTVLRNGQPHDLTLNMAQVAQEADALAPAQQPGGAAPAGQGTPAAPPEGAAAPPSAPPPRSFPRN